MAAYNACLVNNGGCSEVVNCSFVNNNVTCSACPIGYQGNGFSCSKYFILNTFLKFIVFNN